jgi:NAD(P)-dependent dehydrogenase (short-subunit alcohol dehydrogenase family)
VARAQGCATIAAMDLNLRGKAALITGASKGIGRAVAETLAGEGCAVHLVARSAAALETAAEAIRQRHQVSATAHALDLSRSESVAELVRRCGEVDILVNNAGAIPGGSLDMVDEMRWRAAWDLKVFGYINMTRAFLALMEKRGRGVIVNVIGLAGEKPDYGYVAGSAGNASLMAFTRAVGSRSLDKGVRVVAVNPGPVKTDRIISLWRTRAEREHDDPERWAEYGKSLPLGRPAEPREVADLVAFLASERAAYISGTVYAIDGGIGARS